MPMFHAYCQNNIDHAKLADEVSISMSKTLKPSLRARCRFTGYSGSGDYYYFINPIRVISYIVPDEGLLVKRYSGEYRKDYVYGDDEYDKDIFIDDYDNFLRLSTALEIDVYKKNFFRHMYDEQNRYKYDGAYTNQIQSAVVNGRYTSVVMLKAGLKTGDIVRIDDRNCFLIKYSDSYGSCAFIAIAID